MLTLHCSIALFIQLNYGFYQLPVLKHACQIMSNGWLCILFRVLLCQQCHIYCLPALDMYCVCILFGVVENADILGLSLLKNICCNFFLKIIMFLSFVVIVFVSKSQLGLLCCSRVAGCLLISWDTWWHSWADWSVEHVHEQINIFWWSFWCSGNKWLTDWMHIFLYAGEEIARPCWQVSKGCWKY